MKNFYNWLKSRSKIPVRANTPRPYIIPTGIGFSYGILVFILIMVSVNNRNNLIFLFAFFLFSVGLVTMLLTHRNFEKIKLQFLNSSILFKNEPGILNYTLENPRNQESFMISVADKTIEHIESEAKREVQISFKPANYGVGPLPLQRMESRFPLQFLLVWRFVQPEVKITVYPEKINYFATEESQPVEQAGVQQAQSPESLEKEISHFDRFKETDPPQHINWKILAKTNNLYVNKFESQANEQKRVLINWKDTEPLVDLEKRKSQFSFWLDYVYKLKKPFVVLFEEQQILVEANDQKSLVKALRLLL